MAKARAAMREKFLATAKERLVSIGNLLVALEQSPGDKRAADELMREVHTLKGEAKLMQLSEINSVAHELEECILGVVKVGFSTRADTVDVLLRGVDALRMLVASERGEQVDRSEVDTVLGALTGFATHVRGHSLPPPAPLGAREIELAAQLAPSTTVEWIKRGAEHVRLDPVKLEAIGRVSAQILLQRDRTEAAVLSLVRRVEGLSRELEDIERLAARAADSYRANPYAFQDFATELSRRARGFRELRKAARLDSVAVRERVFEGDVIHEELQARVKELRLQPISTLFERFPRAVRDLARSQEKQVRVEVLGTTVEVDKRILEGLAEPLLHILRNAVDHGVETPEERSAREKPPAATVKLRAENRGGSIEIRVEDDGRGIDLESVRRTVRAHGLVDAEQVSALSDEELTEFVFRSGFSTKTAISDLSGRGVGLDAVRRSVQELGGQVSVRTEFGKGTRFTITVPSALLLKPVVLARVGPQRFAIAADRVEQVVRFFAHEVEDVGTAQAIRLEDRRVPLAKMSGLLGVEDDRNDGERTALLLSSHGRRIAMITSEVIGQTHVLERPLDGFLSAMPLLEGIGVTEQGSAIFILSVDQLVSRAESGRFLPTRSLAPSPPGASKRLVLVVDDSEVTRDLVGAVLRSAGYEVIEAPNGRDGLELIRSKKPDVVITDLEMPVLDGFGLLTQVRAQRETEDLPVVVLSTRGSESDKQRGASFGANAYLVKIDFDDRELLKVVKSFFDAGEAT